MTAPSPRALAWRRRGAAFAGGWREFARHRSGLVGLAILLVIVVLALLAPVITDQDGLDVIKATGGPMESPSGEYPLGTDRLGRSVLLLTLWSARVSLSVGLVATLLSVAIGTIIGILAAHFGRWVSATLMRVTDFFLVLPSLVLAIALSTVLARGMGTIILAIGLTSWPAAARVVRAQTLTVEARPYIERSKALGGGHLHVITKHVLPAVMPLVFVNTTLAVGSAIVAESTLSFLGLGDPDPMRPSWGSMLRSAWLDSAALVGAWWYLLPPGIAIGIVVLAFTMCGRALETVLNPRLREG
ncbi:ABC transporter permease [Actinophytocola oryzae]|uniref:Peptide/nickel transport system permease protein n=1 Tax=Actinophytocola oryzae TaxID=502181 RepID=A0A4R7V7I7_9PSEU|nr:ABC transporter permease [Actinophytocola oryzae]TDV43656.1 peptide/nickel transport system permease protein [Actinophytocola oryzae]